MPSVVRRIDSALDQYYQQLRADGLHPQQVAQRRQMARMYLDAHPEYDQQTRNKYGDMISNGMWQPRPEDFQPSQHGKAADAFSNAAKQLGVDGPETQVLSDGLRQGYNPSMFAPLLKRRQELSEQQQEQESLSQQASQFARSTAGPRPMQMPGQQSPQQQPSQQASGFRQSFNPGSMTGGPMQPPQAQPMNMQPPQPQMPNAQAQGGQPQQALSPIMQKAQALQEQMQMIEQFQQQIDGQLQSIPQQIASGAFGKGAEASVKASAAHRQLQDQLMQLDNEKRKLQETGMELEQEHAAMQQLEQGLAAGDPDAELMQHWMDFGAPLEEARKRVLAQKKSTSSKAKLSAGELTALDQMASPNAAALIPDILKGLDERTVQSEVLDDDGNPTGKFKTVIRGKWQADAGHALISAVSKIAYDPDTSYSELQARHDQANAGKDSRLIEPLANALRQRQTKAKAAIEELATVSVNERQVAAQDVATALGFASIQEMTIAALGQASPLVQEEVARVKMKKDAK